MYVALQLRFLNTHLLCFVLIDACLISTPREDSILFVFCLYETVSGAMIGLLRPERIHRSTNSHCNISTAQVIKESKVQFEGRDFSHMVRRIFFLYNIHIGYVALSS